MRTAARTTAGLAVAALLLGTGAGAAGAHGRPHHPHPTPADLGRQVISPGANGWASVATTTAPEGRTRDAAPVTGGAAASGDEVYVVDTWAGLRDALGGEPGSDENDGRGDETPRIVYVRGTIDAFAGPDGERLECQDFADQVQVAPGGEPFTMADYVAAYDPAVWGSTDEPEGPLEDARGAAAGVQAAQTQVHVGSNVTIVGVGDDAGIVGANLRIRDSHNVIVRNLTLSDGYDCFPQWDPTDGDAGNWNSAYDNLSVWTSTSVWVDHVTFDDGDHPASSLPTVFGRPFEVHDGLLDVTHGSDLVTVSYNRFESHDKTMIIGSSDSRTQDRGQHRVTIHHNHWQDIGQRAPRVRFGDVHVYNNSYEQSTGEGFFYLWGAGKESSIVAENNAIRLARGVDAGQVVGAYGGTMLHETGTLVNWRRTDVVAAFNATAQAPLADDARWAPSDHYRYRLLPTRAVDAVVEAKAGAGEIRSALPRALR
ncbi:pectate lyase [Isoptericola sp. NEAU-Y5]|uniref:Pectate lyase n=1 Tax=Isoptericola luteus TaxID=2879484 RepID=A0ABS7ZB75_9MICO|nr:pectate lyase [Isoptericola sp. NEAU-Y5]MCA5892292.1 pectate lyase [Isoptericola sp. NEAU-Y5]